MTDVPKALAWAVNQRGPTGPSKGDRIGKRVLVSVPGLLYLAYDEVLNRVAHHASTETNMKRVRGRFVIDSLIIGSTGAHQSFVPLFPR